MKRTELSPAPGATLHIIGDEALLLHASRQKLIALNAPAAYLWTCVEDGSPVEAVARDYAAAFARSPRQAAREIAGLASVWRHHGFLASSANEPPPPIEGPPARPAAPAEPVMARFHCRLLDLPFELRFDAEGAADLVRPLLAHLACDEGPADVAVEIATTGGGFTIGVDGRQIEACVAPSELAPQVKGAILVEAVNRHGFAACFHAASLRREGGLLLLPGVSGSGKTCLSLALTRAGFAYHSDETALLEPGSLRVRAAPLALCVKEAAWDLVGPDHPELAGLPAHDRIDGKVVKYLPPPTTPGDPALDRAWPVRWIVFPTYSAGTATTLAPIGGAEALRRLLQDCNAWRLDLTAESVERLIAWIEAARCYVLSFSAQAEAVDLISRACRD